MTKSLSLSLFSNVENMLRNVRGFEKELLSCFLFILVVCLGRWKSDDKPPRLEITLPPIRILSVPDGWMEYYTPPWLK